MHDRYRVDVSAETTLLRRCLAQTGERSEIRLALWAGPNITGANIVCEALMTVISLSTIPSRFDKVGPTLESLLAQDGGISEIRLHIPHYYRRFPEYDGRIPKVPEGVTVVRPDTDLGPASKVLHCARDLRGSGRRIIFCDDDQDYPPGWARALIDGAARHPDKAICVRGETIDRLGFAPPRDTHGLPTAVSFSKALNMPYHARRLAQKSRGLFGQRASGKPPRRRFRKEGRVDHFNGVCGVCVDPDWFDDACFDIPPVIWAVDDLMLSGHLARRGVPIWVLAVAAELNPMCTEADDTTPLLHATIEEHDRRQADAVAIRHFQDTHGVWL